MKAIGYNMGIPGPYIITTNTNFRMVAYLPSISKSGPVYSLTYCWMVFFLVEVFLQENPLSFCYPHHFMPCCTKSCKMGMTIVITIVMQMFIPTAPYQLLPKSDIVALSAKVIGIPLSLKEASIKIRMNPTLKN